MNGDVLIDAGPLVALIDRSDDWHLRCRRTLENLRAPLLTVWPAVAEASHILKPVVRGQATLMNLLAAEPSKSRLSIATTFLACAG